MESAKVGMNTISGFKRKGQLLLPQLQPPNTSRRNKHILRQTEHLLHLKKLSSNFIARGKQISLILR